LLRLLTVQQLSLYTPSTGNGSPLLWTSVHHRSSVVFGIRSCSEAHVFLSQYFENTTSHVYEIIIGGSDNTRSVTGFCATLITFADSSIERVKHTSLVFFTFAESRSSVTGILSAIVKAYFRFI
jgi:hypothetical protein